MVRNKDLTRHLARRITTLPPQRLRTVQVLSDARFDRVANWAGNSRPANERGSSTSPRWAGDTEDLGATDCTRNAPDQRPPSSVTWSTCHCPSSSVRELTADRLLDAVIGNGLHGVWSDRLWNNGLERLQKIKGTRLAVETYSTYRALLRAPQAESGGLVDLATRLFRKRTNDRFFSGGDQTEGGGPDNAITADYRLAAVLKKIRYADENPHRWDWSWIDTVLCLPGSRESQIPRAMNWKHRRFKVNIAAKMG